MKPTKENYYHSTCLMWHVAVSVLAGMLVLTTANAQDPSQRNDGHKTFHDPNFPATGTLNAGLITTFTGTNPPPAAVVDVTYGLSGKFAAGVLAGTTGAIALVGIKVNAALLEKSQWRINYRMIMIHYPERNGPFLFDRMDKQMMPWMLSMGAIDAEIQGKAGIRYSIGVGLLETHCIEGMKKYFWGTADESRVSPFEVFQTIQGSVSLPLSRRLVLRPEIILIFKDSDLIDSGAFHVLPVNPYVKFIYSFKKRR